MAKKKSSGGNKRTRHVYVYNPKEIVPTVPSGVTVVDSAILADGRNRIEVLGEIPDLVDYEEKE